MCSFRKLLTTGLFTISILVWLFLIPLAYHPENVMASPTTAGPTEADITAVLITGTLPIYDSMPGSAEDRTIYYNNKSDGIIRVSLNIVGTPPLTLSSNSVFGIPAQAITTTVVPWKPTLNYPIAITVTGDAKATYKLYSQNTKIKQLLLTYQQDIDAPNVTISPIPPIINPETMVTLSWESSDDGAGIANHKVEYKQAGRDWETIAETNSTSIPINIPLTPESTYIFRITSYDNVGNYRTDKVRTCVVRCKIHLPSVATAPPSLRNGEFEDDFEPWETGQGEFNGRGSGYQPQIIEIKPNDHQARIGQPGLINGQIWVGYGYIKQKFTLHNPTITFDYHLETYDVVKGRRGYFDTFEVYIYPISNNPSPIPVVADSVRDSRCRSTLPPPISEKGGLVWCMGNYGNQVGTLNRFSGTVSIDTSSLLGQEVMLYFVLWSREYESPYYNDRAYHNTWVQIDNVTN